MINALYTILLWINIVCGLVLLANRIPYGWVLVVVGMAMGVFRSIRAYRERMNAARGEDEQD